MEYLADTVAIVRFFSQNGKIGREARNIFDNTETGKNKIWISVISLVEIMYLSERNRIPLDLIEFIRKIKISDNYKIIDLDAEIVIVAGNLNGLELHDRLIVATAKYLNVPILTSDQMISNSGFIKVIWD